MPVIEWKGRDRGEGEGESDSDLPSDGQSSCQHPVIAVDGLPSVAEHRISIES